MRPRPPVPARGAWKPAAALAVRVAAAMFAAAAVLVAGPEAPTRAAEGGPLLSPFLSPTGREIERAFDEWRFQAARARLAELAARDPQAAEVTYLEGYARFLEGDYAGASASLGKTAAAAPDDVNVKELRTLARAAEEAVKDHKEARSTHFVVRYPAEDAVLVPYALETLESAYAALAGDLGFAAALPVRVEFYRSPTDLAAVSSLSAAEVERTGTIALCKWARLMVTTPRALSYGYPWLDSINHELVHYAVSELTHDRAPVWLQEGLAKFLEKRWREPAGGRLAPAMEHLLAKALRNGKLIGFDAMHPSMAKLPSAEDASLAFAEVATAVATLHAQGGMAALRTAIAAVADGADARRAVAQAAGGGWAEFERAWKGYMVSLKLRTYPGFDLPTVHIRKGGAIASRRKPSEDEVATTGLRASPSLRHLRLGNILLKRNRPRAAVIEYEKGAHEATLSRGRGGARSGGGGANGPDAAAAQWLFPVKLGRTYLALGQPDQALRAVEHARTTYPDLPWPNLIAGEAWLAKGEPRAAVDAVRASLATNPFDPAVHCTLAEAYARLPDTDRPSSPVIARERQFCKELSD